MTTQNLTRTDQQRMAALARANRVRMYRAEVKRNVKAGADPLPIIRRVPPDLATMRVMDLLMALPKHGRVKAHRVMLKCRIASTKTLGGMSKRQRLELARWLSVDAQSRS